jgi:cation transport ATPase
MGLKEYTKKQIPNKPTNNSDFRKEMDALTQQREAEKNKQVIKHEPLQVTAQTQTPTINKPASTDINHTAQNTDPTIITKKDQDTIIQKTISLLKKKGGRLRRSEKKDVENKEYDKTAHTRMIIIALAVGGLIFITMIRNLLPNEAMYTIIILMGMMMFFPCGIIAGWIFMDPVMRCKILRKTSKRNYGIIGFVGKGMKAVLKIKNFDDGLIWRDRACWVITKDKIIQITKDGNALNNTEKTMSAESVITLVDTVPMVFVDLDSMEPLQLHSKDREPVYPLEIGATLKAWEDNQRAKMMQLRKAQDILLYIAIICAAGAIVVGFLNLQKIETMGKDIAMMKDMLFNMSQLH